MPQSPRPNSDRVLLETARQLGGSLEPDAIFDRLLASVRAALPCNGLIVSSFDRRESLIRCAYAWVGGNLLDPAGLPPLQYRPDIEGMQTQVIRTGRPMMFQDVAERVRDTKGKYYEVDPRGGVRDLADESSEPTTSRSALMAPLLLEGEVVGVVQVMAESESAYTAADLELLEGVSLLLAVSLENARLYRRACEEIDERRRAERVLRDTEEALRHADRRKDEFLATLGHELRNPLNPIRNAVTLLMRQPAPNLESRWSHEVIDRQVSHLTRLIDDLLDIGRITQGKLELRRVAVDLGPVLEDVAEALRPQVEASGHVLSVQRPRAPIWIHGDPVRLAQVFSNLIDNARKYTPTASRIEVIAERRANDVVISVRDQGIGIDPEHVPHVFDLFYQAGGSIDRVNHGLGIGLTLVKRLVEMHGGVIEVLSQGAGCGSTFAVRIPALAEEFVPDTAVTRDPARLPRPLRILVADDNRDSTDSLAILLQLGGNEVHAAYDGEEALRLAGTVAPEVMLLDIGMPGLNGWDVARTVRSQPWGRDMILVAATGWGQAEDRRRSLESGFDDHLVKPVDHETLLNRVAEILARQTTGTVRTP